MKTNEYTYVNKFNYEQKCIIIEACDQAIETKNLHGQTNDLRLIIWIGKAVIIKDLLLEPCKSSELESYEADCTIKELLDSYYESTVDVLSYVKEDEQDPYLTELFQQKLDTIEAIKAML